MKMRAYIKDGVVEIETEYDDKTKKHTITKPPYDVGYKEGIDQTSPINEKQMINGKEWTIQTDKHTGRKTGAMTEDGSYPHKEFDTEQDYEDFIKGAK